MTDHPVTPSPAEAAANLQKHADFIRRAGASGVMVDLVDLDVAIAALAERDNALAEVVDLRGGLRAAAENVLARRAELDVVEAERDAMRAVVDKVVRLHKRMHAGSENYCTCGRRNCPTLAAVDTYRAATP